MTMGKKKMVWIDVNEVVKASVVPKKKKDIYIIMTTVPKGQGK